MSRLIYSGLIYLLLPLLFLRLWLKGRQSPAYRLRWRERLGYFSPPANHSNGICFHCVSVGETIAAIPLIKQIQNRYPELAITVTSTTPTGSKQVTTTFGDSVFHVYLPFDTPGAVLRFLGKIRPRLLVILETELWPNLLHSCQQMGVKTLLANARLSARSAAGYAKIGRLSRQMMADIDLICTHHHQDGERFIQLGLAKHKRIVTGSIKFDLSIDDTLQQRCQTLKSQWAPNRPVWVVGSTHIGEEQQILSVFSQVLATHPNLLLVLVPRHPERFAAVAQLINDAKLTMIKRSDHTTPSANVQVVLGDTMGELLLLWGIADFAFVGGSLVERGGHNPLEPAALAIPVITGQHFVNFQTIYQLMLEQQAVLVTTDLQQLLDSVLHLLTHQSERKALGNRGLSVVEANRGALTRLTKQIVNLIDE